MMPAVGEPGSWRLATVMMVLLAATQAVITASVALGRIDTTAFGATGRVIQIPLLLISAAGFWQAYRFSLVDVPMTMTWWRTSAAKNVVVLSLLASATVEAAMWISGLKPVHAITAVALAALAFVWWRGFPGGGGGWEDVPAPDPDLRGTR